MRTRKGLVFVWMGEGEPAPIEEDVPEEFFAEDALAQVSQVYWKCNWEVALLLSCTRPKNAWRRLWDRVAYALLRRWIIEYNFSRQDERVMLNQRYDTLEKLSGSDAEVIQRRRLVVSKHYGGRDAPFEYRNPDDLPPDRVPLERVSVRYMQEQARTRAARS